MFNRKEILHAVFPLLHWWPMVGKKTIRADLLAGLTGAVIVLPQGVAFALIAGLPPVYGLYTAIVVPIVAGLFGSSLHVVSGPNTAISLVVFSAISGLAEPGSEEFVQLAFVLTFLAGAFQLGLGLARLGVLTNFVSGTVVVGFTAGAAILIATSQLKHALGMTIPGGEGFLPTWRDIILQIPHINLNELAVGAGTLLIAILFRKISKKLPHLLIAMVLGSVLAAILGGSGVGIRFVEEIPAKLPPFEAPELSVFNFRRLSSNAFAIALLGLIQAVAIARSIAAKTHQRIDGNQEFIGQGLSNVVGSFFSSYAGSGSFTRSGVNYETGARTPLSAVFASLILAGFLLLVAPLATHLPMSAMGGIILLVAFNLIDFQHIKGISKASKKENAVLITTFLATLFMELEFAIYIGVFLSLIFYLQRTSRPHVAIMAPDSSEPGRRFLNLARKPLTECPQLKIVRIDGSLYYGAIDHISAFLDELSENHPQRHLLILANGINFVDISGAEFLVQEAMRWRARGGDFYICGLKFVAQDVLISGGFRDQIGADHFFSTKKDAIPAIFKRLDPKICETCQARIFLECNQ